MTLTDCATPSRQIAHRLQLSCGVVCVILSRANLTQYRHMTDRQTNDTQQHIPR